MTREPFFEVQIEQQLHSRRGGTAFRLELAFESQQARTVLCGPSGAGKSLTLQAIAGLKSWRLCRTGEGLPRRLPWVLSRNDFSGFGCARCAFFRKRSVLRSLRALA